MSGMMLAFAGGSYGAPPLNTVAPAVTGTASFGSTLTTTNGTWTGLAPITFTYQWQRVTTDIGGATSSTYTLVAADVGNTIRCVVKATNSVAPSGVTANSNSTASVAAIVPTAPTIGTATATSATTATVSYTASSSNGGATITSYTAVSSPSGITGSLATSGSGTITVSGLAGGTSYTFTVFATNSAGNSPSSSASNSITTTPVIGQAYQGGFCAGQITQSSVTYNLVMSPFSSGQIYGRKYFTSFGGVTTTDNIDGPTNTAAAAANGPNQEAATWTDALTIGGYTDWYIPARYEWYTLLYFLKPSNTNNSNVAPTGATPNAVAPQPVNTNWTAGSPARTTAANFIFINAFDPGNGAECLADLPYSNSVTFWTSTGENYYNQFAINSGVASNYNGYVNQAAKPGTFYMTRAIRRVVA